MTGAFQAEVLDIREESRLGGRQQWQMLLSSTAFSPSASRGVLHAVARSGATLDVCVLGVVMEGDEVWHRVDKPLAIGTPISGELAVPTDMAIG